MRRGTFNHTRPVKRPRGNIRAAASLESRLSTTLDVVGYAVARWRGAGRRARLLFLVARGFSRAGGARPKPTHYDRD